MRGQLVAHAVGADAQGGQMVGAAAEQMLHIVGAGGTAPLLVGVVLLRTGAAIIGIIIETVEIESAGLYPEVRVLIAKHHDGRSATVILVGSLADFRIGIGGNAECILQVHAGAFPSSPEVTELTESFTGNVALDGILGRPDTAGRGPQPGNEVLTGLLVHGGAQAENVGVLGRKAAAGMLDHVQGIIAGLFQVFLVQATGNAGLGQIYLGEEAFGGIVIDTIVLADVGILRKKLQSLFQRYHDILVHIGLLNLHLLIVSSILDHFRIVVDNGNVTEGTDQKEVCHGLPGERFTDGLVLSSLAGLCLGVTDIVDDGIALSVHGPQGVGHVLEVCVGTVDGKRRIGRIALVDVSGHGLGTVNVETDYIVPRRVVEVVHGLLYLDVVQIIVGSGIAVFGRTVQELGAGSGRKHSSCSDNNIFNCVFHLAVLH